ncbi:MJ0042 family finger-like domain-containing protein [Roseomonas rosea]|uniref:MJ0042 family finger-like domain-containing protein n=1 Tax=Muricoccus roseus TaxID=198092 RepID=A0A1M6FWR5_9PROT|nr:zinc-ribbon domain-containing protein [Roseomonas rosea]SHJ02181.1 MJ0042 family finger-like domain-containing protein [Roseomonas rosea]
MRVACPECAAEYDLPPALAARLAEGRSVRCARCGTSWAPGVPQGEAAGEAGGEAGGEAQGKTGGAPGEGAEEPAPQAPPLPPPNAFEAGEPPPRPSAAPPATPDHGMPAPDAEAAGGLRVVGLAWGASLLVLAVAAAAAWHWRVDLVEAWPPAARVFIALGAG